MSHDHISVHAAARDETRRGRRLADALRGRTHTRATVADQLAQPAGDLPPVYRQVRAALGQEGPR